MALRVIFTTIVSVIAAYLLMDVADFLSASRDHSEEETVGVIARCGWPFCYSATADGWSWNKFNGLAYLLGFGFFFALSAGVGAGFQYLAFKSKRPRRRVARAAAAMVVAFFICAPARAEEPPENPQTEKFTKAAFGGDLETVKSILDAGTDVNARNRTGRRALYYAASNGNDEVALFLLTRGALPDTTGGTRGTTLMNAASMHCPKTLQKLLELGVRTNTKDEKGWTALMLAAHKNDVVAVKLLVEHRGTKLNLRNWGGDTALHCAAWAGAQEVVEYLLGRGADATIQNDAGETALDYAHYQSTSAWMGEASTDKAKKIMSLLKH